MRPSFYRLVQHLNELKNLQVISEYAVGGGIAAYEYTSVPTRDIDVFILLTQPSGIVNLSPIYDYFRRAGGQGEGEWLVVEGFPVELFVASDELEEEAVRNALPRAYRDSVVRMFRPEYIVAISLRLGRPKDIYRVRALLESRALDNELLHKIIRKHGLGQKLRTLQNGKA